MTPTITVCIPAYNGGDYLRPAIESVLNQTYSSLQIILVDDGSNDGSTEGLESIPDPRLKIIRQANSGRPRALNRAIAEADGQYICIQDADDLSHPERIQRLAEALDRDREVAAVFSGIELIINEVQLAPNGRAKDQIACAQDIAALRMPAHDTTAMFRAEAIRGMSFDPDMVYVEAYDFILRLGERRPMIVIPDVLYSYRIHAQSITRKDPTKRMQAVARAQAVALSRRGRAAPPLAPLRIRRRDLDNNIAAFFMESAAQLHDEGRLLESIRQGLACGRLAPADPHYWKALLFALCPRALRTRLRPSERSHTSAPASA